MPAQVGVGQAHPVARERSAEVAVDVGHVGVERQDGHGWQDPRREHLEVSLPRRRPVRPVVQLADGDSAGELVVARDGGEPGEVAGVGSRLQNLA